MPSLASRCSPHMVTTCPFRGLVSIKVFAFLWVLLLISLLKMTPKDNAKVPSSYPKQKEVSIFSMKTMHELGRLIHA